ncbi:MAG: hypothetical protein J6Y94_08100, partial [Bacteriovoracaceae bacterium]|nr:hypothetical protein [Bacteriovoracaceae bacterium]
MNTPRPRGPFKAGLKVNLNYLHHSYDKIHAGRSIILSTLFFSLLFLLACSEVGGDGRHTSAAAAATPTATPIFSGQDNYLQNGTNTSTSYLYLPRTFADDIYLRGKQIHYFINHHAVGENICGGFYFAELKTLLIFALRPQSIYNFQEGAREYYYLMALSDATGNTQLCQNAQSAIVTWFKEHQQISTSDLALLQVAYDFVSAARQSTNRLNAGQGLKLFRADGFPLDEITTASLKLAITWATEENAAEAAAGRTCTSNQECKAWGMDCCSFGICVNNGELRPNIDVTSAEFLQAQKDIAAYPEHILNSPQFYYLCANIPQSTPAATPTVNAQEAAYQHFLQKQELYQCANPQPGEGEVAYCTQTFYHPQFNVTEDDPVLTFVAGNDDRNFYNTYSGTKAALYNLQNIKTVRYGDITLIDNYEPAAFATAGERPLLMVGDPNDDLTHGQKITLDNYQDAEDVAKTKLQPNSLRDYLKLTYRIDGSCVRVNSVLAKCFKVYIQGQDEATPLDHFPLSNRFKLPLYADLTRKIQVTINGDLQTEGKHWQLA